MKPQSVAILVNQIAPARLPVYRGLADHFVLSILHGGTEDNRNTWQHIGGLPSTVTVKPLLNWQLRSRRTLKGEVFDHHYLHVPVGALIELVRLHPDAVVTNEMGIRTLCALIYGTLFRKPVWVWWGGTVHTERKIRTTRRVVRYAIARWATNWVSYGRTSTAYLTSLGIPTSNILELQNSVDEQQFGADGPQLFAVEPRPVVLYTGQLIARKGVELLLRAAASLQRQGYQFSLLLVGNGPGHPALEALATHLELKHVQFHPGQLPGDMPSVYRSADLLIFPTLEDVWGLVCNEALLSGIPVLCSQYAGCAPELFDPESIFDPKDQESFICKFRAAVTGALPRPAPERLRSTAEIVTKLACAIDDSISRYNTSDRSQLISRREPG
jgi:glycosyltransferase involved in cell wall biosynthesis